MRRIVPSEEEKGALQITEILALETGDKNGSIETGMTGTDIFDLCKYMVEHDANGDGSIDFDEFSQMLRTTRQACNLFTGSENPDCLTDVQIETLLLFHGWPGSHEAVDNSESDGVGGMQILVDNVIEGVHAEKEEEETDEMAEAREDREENLTEDGWLRKDFDHDEPQLVLIHELISDLQLRADSGHLSKLYMSEDHGWEKDIKKAIKIWVEEKRSKDSPDGPSNSLPEFISTIQVRLLPTHDKWEKLFLLARHLVSISATAIPNMVWTKVDRQPGDESELSDDEKIMNRLVSFLSRIAANFGGGNSLR